MNNQYSWIKYINKKYGKITKWKFKELEEYCNSSQYDIDIDYWGSFTDPIDTYYNDNLKEY